MMELRNILQGKSIYFDTNIFIYLLEGNTVLEPVLETLRKLISHEQIQVHSSQLVYTEILAHKKLV